MYWWFSQERDVAQPKKPSHSYYASLFGEVDQHLNVALACALIFEDFVIPAADAVWPGFGDLRHFSAADLGLEVSEWEPVHEARRLSAALSEDWRSDPVLAGLLARKSETEVQMELHYAVADVLLAAEYNAPVLCSDGRRAVVRRLLDLGVVAAQPGVLKAFSSDRSVSEMVDSYANLVSLTFAPDGIRAFADLKWMSPLREYADGFQRILNDPRVRSVEDFYEAIAVALESKSLAESVQGTFKATGSVMDIAGLVPGVGTVAGLVGIGAAASAAAAQKQADRFRWVELGDVVASAHNLLAVEAKIRALGLR
jgi:hypothetical protein